MTDDVDALFDLPADEFVAARDDLVARLKAAGDADRVAAVKALRRPSLAAWAVNQVVRADPAAFEALVAAGRTMQKAQRRALSGVRDSGLRDASTTRRRLVESLAHHAEHVLVEAGARPASHLDDVVATFEAASADPDAAATVSAARLSAPVHVTTDFSGTSALLAVSLPPASDDGTDGTDDEDPQRAARRREAIRSLESTRRRAEASATAAQAAREEARALATAAAGARRAADEARAAAERAAAEADDVAEQAATAEEAAVTATATAEADANAVESARTILEELD